MKQKKVSRNSGIATLNWQVPSFGRKLVGLLGMNSLVANSRLTAHYSSRISTLMRRLLEKGFSGNMSPKVPFDFSQAMRLLCEDIAKRSDVFRHIEMDRIAVTFAQARSRVSYGLQAKLTPMRFERGDLFTVRYGRTWTVQRLYHDNREMLYILTFYLPRFQNQTFREKMVTVFHELFHISPNFDGDIRRMEGRYHVHSHSQKEYDQQMEVLVDQYFASGPPKELYQFLRMRFRTLERNHQGVVGLQVPIPKLIPVPDSKSA